MGATVMRRSQIKAGMLIALLALGSSPAAADNLKDVARELVAAFDRTFKGPYPGARAIHAKGIVCKGIFTADAGAMGLTVAPHLRAGSELPVIVRFSAFSGIPSQPDGRPGTNPIGMAVKFILPDGVDTDIVAHAYDGFPVGTPDDFIAYLNAMGQPGEREKFLAEHPSARRFVNDPKPTPLSYATEMYFGVHAFRFTNSSAVSRYGRYRIYPIAGARHLSKSEAEAISPSYLNAEIKERLREGPVEFRLTAQLATSADNVLDGSAKWPSDRAEVPLGTLSLKTVDERSDDTVFFSPMNLVPGIAASPDPLLAARTRAYAISLERRVQGE